MTTISNLTTGQRILIGDDTYYALSVADLSIGGALALTVGTTATAGRMLSVNATVAGNVAVTFADASTYTFPVVAGLTLMPFSVTKVNTSGTTATATYHNLF